MLGGLIRAAKLFWYGLGAAICSMPPYECNRDPLPLLKVTQRKVDQCKQSERTETGHDGYDDAHHHGGTFFGSRWLARSWHSGTHSLDRKLYSLPDLSGLHYA